MLPVNDEQDLQPGVREGAREGRVQSHHRAVGMYFKVDGHASSAVRGSDSTFYHSIEDDKVPTIDAPVPGARVSQLKWSARPSTAHVSRTCPPFRTQIPRTWA